MDKNILSAILRNEKNGYNLIQSFSGGRTSAKDVYHTEEVLRPLGVKPLYIFNDTGWEDEATYEFVRNVVDETGIDLHCLKGVYTHKRGVGPKAVRVGLDEIGTTDNWRDFAKVYGTPINPDLAHCSDRLKTDPAKAYARELGVRGLSQLLGIRSDEPLRLLGKKLGEKLLKSGISREEMSDMWPRLRVLVDNAFINEMDSLISHSSILKRGEEFVSQEEKLARVAKLCNPFISKRDGNLIYMADTQFGIEKQDVIDFWAAKSFDLGIEEHRGNCLFCPKKSDLKVCLAARECPEQAEKWREMLRPGEVRILPLGTPDHRMYRHRKTFDDVVNQYDGFTDNELRARIRSIGSLDTGSCSESCEAFG